MNNNITIEFKNPLLVATLKAISKHTAELATDLEIINNTICPECGDKLNVKWKPDTINMVRCACPRCAYSGFHKAEFFVEGIDKHE